MNISSISIAYTALPASEIGVRKYTFIVDSPKADVMYIRIV